jgi:hypothetical protein
VQKAYCNAQGVPLQKAAAERLDTLLPVQEQKENVGISRYASMLDGFFNNLVEDPHFVEIMNQDLKNGQHRNPKSIKGYFTTAYLHHPRELKEEIIEAGFNFRALIGIDGFGWLLPAFDDKWRKRDYQNLLLQSIRSTEEEHSIIGVSAHIMGIALK